MRRPGTVRAGAERHLDESRLARTTGRTSWWMSSTPTSSGEGRGAGNRMGGIPLIKPPYANLTAIDLNKGEFAWQIPFGEGSPALRNHPMLRDKTLPERLGSDNKGGVDRDGRRSCYRRRGRQLPLRVRQDDRPRSMARSVAVRQQRDADDVPDEVRRAVRRRRNRLRRAERTRRVHSRQLSCPEVAADG